MQTEEELVELASVESTGPIASVVVHGSGAVITRRITMDPELPRDAFDLIVTNITPLADPGSVRVTLPDGSRELVAVTARMIVPTDDEGPGETSQKVRDLNRRVSRLQARGNMLVARVDRLQEAVPIPMSDKALREEGPAMRARNALDLSAVLSETIAALDERIVQCRRDLDAATKERDAAVLQDCQTSGAERAGAGHPHRAFALRIAAGEQSLDSVELSYAVPHAAKWWPRYTLRLTEGGKHATLAIEALVAQRTMEDWEGVPIGLSTSAIIFDATMPKLPSLRLGRRQRPPTRGYREPPSGVDELFASYDSFHSGAPPTPKSIPKSGRVTMRDEVPTPVRLNAIEMDTFGAVSGPPPTPSPALAQSAPGGPPSAMAAPAMSRSAAPSRKRRYAPAPEEAKASAGGLGASMAESAPLEPSFEPTDDWLAFDLLVLSGADGPGRGRLRIRRDKSGFAASDLDDARQSAQRLNLVDPAVSRGIFDYRYDAEGSARIPADGRLHRVQVMDSSADCTLQWRTTPLSDPAVYREAALTNPYESPLLAGPVDVFSEGQLVTTTAIQRVDSGGAMRVGLGIDERIRVSRNVRMSEESAGLLGGKRELHHEVEIELRSGINDRVRVDVIDRIPVTNDDDVSVEVVNENPTSTAYDQSELGQPVKGGRRWQVRLEPGGKQTLTRQYKIRLRAKDELVGGNRRD